MGYPVNSPTELSASIVVTIIRDLTTTVQSVAIPSGAKWVHLSYRLLPGATAVTNQFAKFVVNASTDSDAAAKLATDNTNIPLFQGDDVSVGAQSGSLITRLDLVTGQAVGAEKTVVRIMAGI